MSIPQRLIDEVETTSKQAETEEAVALTRLPKGAPRLNHSVEFHPRRRRPDFAVGTFWYHEPTGHRWVVIECRPAAKDSLAFLDLETCRVTASVRDHAFPGMLKALPEGTVELHVRDQNQLRARGQMKG